MLIRLIILFLLAAPASAMAQSRYNFFTIGVEQGLSNPDIWSINQDKYGYIWIATVNGLNRYDGHKIKQYFNRKEDSTSIAGNTCFWIFRDSDQDLWFACGYAGMSRYNYATGNFESLPAYDSARKHNQFTSPVWRFGEDRQKRIYLSCGGACYRYDKRTKKFEDLTPLFGPGWNHGIGRFYAANDSIMWIPTDDGLFRYNVIENKMRRIPFDKEKLGYGVSFMYDIEPINDHEMIISTGRAGYIKLDTRTETFSPADDQFNPAKTGKLTEMAEILVDSRKRYWMANTEYGLLEYQPATGRSILMKKEPLYPYPYAEQEGAGKTIFEDRDGNIWYGTATQGIIRFQPDFDFIRLYSRDFSSANHLPDNYVMRFASLPDGNMILGTTKGIAKFNPATNTYTRYPYSVENNSEFPGAHVRYIERVGDTLCLATSKGLTIYDAARNKFKTYIQNTDSVRPGEQSVFTNSLWFAFNTAPGELIIGATTAGRFYPATGKCLYRANTKGDPLYELDKIAIMMFDKKNRRIWIDADKKLYTYNVDSKQLVQHEFKMPGDTVPVTMHAMCVDSSGTLWMGTSRGIVSYNPVTKKQVWTNLPSANTPVVNVYCEKDVLWFTTRNEIGRWKYGSAKPEIFIMQALLPNVSIVHRSMKKDANGQYYIGHTQGFFILDPTQFISNEINYHPRLVSFKVFDAVKDLGASYNDVDHIDLRYGENFFSFDFSSFNFQNNQKGRYAYMLENFDKDWNYTTENSASYTNVPPGKYVLRIRSANSAGEWDEMQHPITIHIQPPFWKTWYFILMMFVLLALLFIWLWRIRARRREKQQFEKTIDYFANSVYGENSVNEICWDIARNCISQMQFEDCVVYLLDEKTNRLQQKAAYGPKNPKGHEIVDPIEIEKGKGIVGTVAVTGKPLLIADTSKDERYIVDDEVRYSELAVPILHDGKVIGVIDSENSRKNFFTENHLKAMATIASISANKIAEAQAEEYARENEIKLLEIRKMLAESQLMALRAQMNPHFVFNCLNSIQECIVTQKYGEASKYLNKFSKLFRTVLNNSGKNLVTLNEEKEVLELYLELEQMRFEKSFTHEIEIDEDLEMEEILIPSMLLQPYVENALWHGLMHKDGDRRLLIKFEKLGEDVFRCTIDDNGIGREKSFALKAQQSKAKRHESKGLKISKDRIDVLQRQGFHATLDIIDKKNGNGEADGTAVAVELSTFLKN